MKRLLFIVLTVTVRFTASAEDAKPTLPDPYEWTIRSYRFPADEMRTGFVSREKGQLQAPAMPPANASKEEIQKFIKSSNDVAAQYLLIEGLPLLKGSLAVIDAEHDMLVVRTVNATHDLIHDVVQAFLNRVPMYLSFNTHIIEADESVVLQFVKDAPGQADHKTLWDRMQALAAQGQARFIGTLNVDTRSGQRASVSRVSERMQTDGFLMDDLNNFELSRSTRKVGTTFEVDPVIGPDGRTIDVNFALEHDFAPPTERWEPAAQSGQRRIESRMTDYHMAKVTTATTILSGMTKLLGVWKPEPSQNRGNVMQAAFLKGEVVPVLPLPDNRAEQMLRAEGEAVEATPPKPKTSPMEGLPPGMILRRFRVPPNFLSSPAAGGAAAAAAASVDPFASAVPPRSEARAMRSVTALDVLKMNGIPFPDGASANFSPASGELIVRNTPENLKLVEALLDELSKTAPMVLGVTVQVVQADGALLRKMGADMSSLADHTNAWRGIEEAIGQGKAKLLNTGWVETRSGQRSGIHVGTEYMHAGAPTFAKAPKSDGKPTDAAAKSDAPASRAVLALDHETKEVGFYFEIDPVIGPDGQTIDINVALNYDTAPPTQRFAQEAAGDKLLRVEAPATDFHQGGMSTALTLKDGTTHFLGVWKPEGNPELENADVLQAAFVKVNLLKVEDAAMQAKEKK